MTRLAYRYMTAGTRRQRRRLAAQSKWPPPLVILTGVALIVGLGTIMIRSFTQNDALRREEQTVAAEWDRSWPPLPRPPAHLALPMADVQVAYLFAAKHEDVLKYLPCYCGCQLEGHRSNRDCYIRGHAATGAPVWDTHAYTCGLCLNIARDAKHMRDQGRTVPQIRQAIEAQYAPRYGVGTPTPRPPDGE